MSKRATNRRRSRLLGFLVALSFAIAPAGGCALRHEENRPLATRIGRELIPESKGMKIATSPLLVVAGGLGLTFDLLRYPLTIADDAARDTRRLCWSGFGQPGRYATDCGSLPVRVAGMPIVFLIDASVRLVGDVDPSPLDPRPDNDRTWEID